MSFFDYDADSLEEGPAERIEDCFGRLESPTTTWVNVYGLHEVDVIRAAADQVGLHALLVEDILDTHQRPKVEEHGDLVFVVLRMLSQDPVTGRLENEQVTFVLGPTFVFSFQERRGDVFEPIRERIRTAKGRIRKRGSDYLLYALIDAVVDRYFVVLESLGDQVEDLESSFMANAGSEGLQELQSLRRDALSVRRAVWPLRDALGTLVRGEPTLIQAETQVFLRDVHDHALRVIETTESLRELLAGVMDLHMSLVSNRMNEVMKVLTIMASVFIPLSFLAGLYGMNFDYMPELHYRWGYPALLVAMSGVVIGLLIYFRRKDWI